MKSEEVNKIGSLADIILYTVNNNIDLKFSPDMELGTIIKLSYWDNTYGDWKVVKMHLGEYYIEMVKEHKNIALLDAVKYLLGTINDLKNGA